MIFLFIQREETWWRQASGDIGRICLYFSRFCGPLSMTFRRMLHFLPLLKFGTDAFLSDYILRLIENLYSCCFWARDGNRKWTFRMPGQWSLPEHWKVPLQVVISFLTLNNSCLGSWLDWRFCKIRCTKLMIKSDSRKLFWSILIIIQFK